MIVTYVCFAAWKENQPKPVFENSGEASKKEESK